MRFVKNIILSPVFLVLGVLLLSTVSYISLGATTSGAEDSHIIELYIDDQVIVSPTRAKTVGQFLEQRKIAIDSTDSIIPTVDKQIVENISITVERARPVRIVDGGTTRVVITSASDIKSILSTAGTNIKDEDLISLESLKEPDLKSFAYEQVSIVRAKTIKLNLYGVVAEARTHSSTVEEFLKEKSIVPISGDTMQPSNTKTPVTDGMLLSINKIGIQTITAEEPIAFATETVSDPTLNAGTISVVTAGSNGVRSVIYELETKDGVEVSRKELQAVVTKEPVKEVKKKGTKSTPTYTVTGDKASIMLAAGIPADQHTSVDYIITKESGWRVSVVNSIGCIGLAQRCPNGGSNALAAECPNWESDPVCQLVHFSRYANGRYGSWNAAYGFWIVNNWW
jgi:resuscitation-promoting factor RpfB